MTTMTTEDTNNQKPITVGIIGCGDRGTQHAKGYAASPQARIIAVVDPKPEAIEKFTGRFDVAKTYASHEEMFAEVTPDIISVCTWTGLHPEHVLASSKAGVRAIHSEKPMAPTWGEAKRMAQACDDAGIQLTFCHQRRFAPQFVKTRELIKDGAIGEVYRIEGFCSNLFDWGTHWFDMFQFYNDETPPEWVMGQIDTAQAQLVFGVPVESNGLSQIQYANGVQGLLITGDDIKSSCSNRILGSQGVIEVEVSNGPRVRMLREGGAGWETVGLESVTPPHGDTTMSILDALDCLQTGRTPTLSSHNALRSTELIFATYESSRRRARIMLPLDIEDSPLFDMLGEASLPLRP